MDGVVGPLLVVETSPAFTVHVQVVCIHEPSARRHTRTSTTEAPMVRSPGLSRWRLPSRRRKFVVQEEVEMPESATLGPIYRNRVLQRYFPSSDMDLFDEEEEEKRCGVFDCLLGCWDAFMNALLDLMAAVFVFNAMQSAHTVLALLVSAGSITFYHFYDGGRMSVRLDWQFVSFAVIFPLTYFIGEGYKRRDFALQQLANIKSLSIWIYLAHRDWDVTKGRSKDHKSKVLKRLQFMIADMAAYFAIPRVYTRNYFYGGWRGKKTALWIETNRLRLTARITNSLKMLSVYCEDLKVAGLPTNEAARLNQYNMLISSAFFKMINVKNYRTPQGIRSFARFYVIIMPVFYGPYFSWVSQETGSFAFALCLGLMGTLTLVGLLNVAINMEDPLESAGVDSVRVVTELEGLQKLLLDDRNFEDELEAAMLAEQVPLQ